MRLFIAAELPGSVREALAETSACLRASVHGRYVAPDSLHVTLAFLGEVEAHRVDDVVRALQTGCKGHVPIGVELGELGSFGKRSSATLWQGLRADGEKRLAALASDMRAALEAEGITFDAKKFVAHITLMRAADLTSGVLPAPILASGTVDTVTLFRSDLSGPRPVYEALERMVLGD